MTLTFLDELITRPEVREILQNERFRSLSRYRHHGSISCLEHTLLVTQRAYVMARKRNLDVVSTVRGALLHDFYLYDWHIDGPGLHGFKHPRIALRNAERYFALNAIERDAILRHMWPLTPIPPRHPESWVVSMADKWTAAMDYTLHTGELFQRVRRSERAS